MTDLAARREQYVEALARDLDHLVDRLSRMPAVHRVILFGSYAAGRRDLWTDLDVLVVMDSPLDFVTRNVELARGIGVNVALDLLAYIPHRPTKPFPEKVGLSTPSGCPDVPSRQRSPRLSPL